MQTSAGQIGQKPCTFSVLLADDEEMITTLFKAILKKEFPHATVEVAENGKDCIDRFKKTHHRVILMDLHMPVKDGLTAYKELRALCTEREWEMPAVIFFTGYAPPEAIREILTTDARHDVLMKPVGLEPLIDTVRGKLEEKKG